MIVIRLKESMTEDTLSPASAGALNFMSYLFHKTRECCKSILTEQHDVRRFRVCSLQLKQVVQFLRSNLEDGVYPVDDIFERSIIFLGRTHLIKNVRRALHRDRSKDVMELERECALYLKESLTHVVKLNVEEEEDGWSSDSDEDEIEVNVMKKYLNMGRVSEMTRRRADHDSWKAKTSIRRGTYFGYRPANRVRANDDGRPRDLV